MRKTKTAAIFYGTGSSPEDFWLPWLRENLEKDGYDVFAPSFPEHEDGFAHLDLWETHYLKETPHRNYTLLIGHSAGGPLILTLLSKGLITADHVILVATFINPLPKMSKDHPTFPGDLNHAKIKNAVQNFTYIHSDNDPWGCDHIQGDALRQAFGGILIIKTGEGHFGSGTFDQPYPDFPLLYSLYKL